MARAPKKKAPPKAAPKPRARPAAARSKAARPAPKRAARAAVKPRPAKSARAPKPAPKKAPAKAAPAKPAARKPEPKGPAAKAPARAATKAPVAKAPVAKPPPPPPPPPKKPRKPELTPKEIAQVKAALEAQRIEFLREAEDIEEGAFNVSQSEMSGEVSFDEEYADAGSFTFEREKELSIGNNIRDLLEKVAHALHAIERGTYGICENCGDPINKARLLALPYSTLCIRCKQQEERTR